MVLTAFDAFLADRGLRFEAVVIGGTALNLLGVVRRTTRDCDVLHPEIPATILQAAKDFATERSGHGDPLQSDWLNNGPASLTKVLPRGWQERLLPVFSLILPWLQEQDGNPEWPAHVIEVLDDLKGRLDHGL